MMNAHQLAHLASLAGRPSEPLAAGQAMSLGSHGGQLRVIAGRVWLTREGELDDRIVQAGESICIEGTGGAVIEAWDDARPALIAWRPHRLSERTAEAWRSARTLAARLFGHNAADAAGAPGGRARGPAPQAGRCAAGTA